MTIASPTRPSARRTEHLASTDVPVLDPSERVSTARSRLTRRRYGVVRDVPVCDATRRLVGVMRIEDLLAAPDDARVGATMDVDPPTSSAPTHPQAISRYPPA